jgi:hypothetical protein
LFIDGNMISVSGTLGPISATPSPDVWLTPVWPGLFTGYVTPPCTPLITYFDSTPNNVDRIRVRVRGLDQFGHQQVEISPWVSKVIAAPSPYLRTMWPMSKVFSYVSSMEYQSEGAGLALAQLGISVSPVWDQVNPADPTGQQAAVQLEAREYLHLENMGIASPLRIAPSSDLDPVVGNVLAYNHTQQVAAHIVPFDGVVAGYTVGASAAGFEGYPHKIGFQSPDAWVTKVQRIGGGEFRLGGEVAGAAAIPVPDRVNDVLEFFVTVRSSLGSRQDTHPETSYVWG